MSLPSENQDQSKSKGLANPIRIQPVKKYQESSLLIREDKSEENKQLEVLNEKT